MPRLTVRVDGTPRPSRPRITQHGNFNAKPVRDYMNLIRDHVLVAMAEAKVTTIPEGVPVALMLDVWLPWAKGTSKKKIAVDPYALHTVRPDTENLLKPIKDACTEAGLWRDDCQIAQEYTEKRRCPRGEERIELVVTWQLL